MLVYICYIGHRFASLVNDEAWTAGVWEFIDALVSNNLDEFHVTVLDSN
jgi:hypothetical protein